MKVLKRVIKITLAIVVLTGILATAACSAGGGQGARIDEPAPGFTLKDLDGRSVSLSSFKGKTVFINFWDSSFEYSTDDIAFLHELHEEWSQTGEIILLTIDTEEDADTIKAFMAEKNYSFPVLLDRQYEVAGKYNVNYIPTTLMIDKEGRFKFKVEGPFRSRTAFEKQIAGYLP